MSRPPTSPRLIRLPASPRSPGPFANPNAPSSPSSPSPPRSSVSTTSSFISHGNGEDEVHDHDGSFTPHISLDASSSYEHAPARLNASILSPLSRPLSPSRQARGANPDHSAKYAVIEIAARLGPGVILPIYLCFHRSWNSQLDQPIVLLFKGSSILRLVGPVESLDPFPRVRIRPPIDLYLLDGIWDHDRLEAVGDGDDTGGDIDAHRCMKRAGGDGDTGSGDEHRDCAAEGGHQGSRHRGKYARQDHRLESQHDKPPTWMSRCFLSALLKYLLILVAAQFIFSLLLLSSHQIFVPLPLHLPLLHLARSIDPARAPISTLINDLESLWYDLGSVCEQPFAWKRLYRDDQPGPGQLWDRELWSTEDDGEEAARFPGATREDMRELAQLCADGQEQLLGCAAYARTTGRASVKHATAWVGLLLNHVSRRLSGLHGNSLEISEQSVEIYLKALEDILEDSHTRRGAKHARRNPNAWKTVQIRNVSYETAIDSVQGLVADFHGFGQRLQQIAVVVEALGTRLTALGIEHTALDLIPMLQAQSDSILAYSHPIQASLNQTLALQSSLRHISWTNGYPNSFSSRSSQQAEVDFWAALWTLSGVVNQTSLADFAEARSYWVSKQNWVNKILALFFLRPKLQIMVPSLEIQLNATRNAYAATQGGQS